MTHKQSSLLLFTQHSIITPPEQKRHQALPAGIRNDPCSFSVGLKSVILYFRPNSIPSILRVSAIVAKSRINLELHPTNLRKLLTSEAVVGRLASFTARTFSPYVQHRVLEGMIMISPNLSIWRYSPPPPNYSLTLNQSTGFSLLAA